MIIDFHTHIFPEKLAQRALSKLSSCIKMEPGTNGCAEGLRSSMQNAGIDLSIVLPVVTDICHFDSILRFSEEINERFGKCKERKLISFGGIHPADPDFRSRLNLLKAEGFAGVKIHPNYQSIDFNDIQVKRFLSAASEIGLPVLTHAGFDPYTPQHEYCSPDMITEVLDEVAPENLILAHLGNNEHYQESEDKLCGRNVYLDTAYSISRISEEQLIRMIRKHGADRILFATDSPWASQKECVDILHSSSLTDHEKEQIFCKNAQRLLQISGSPDISF